ncbi:MAG: outer membrane lipoprotein LolB [Rubrivivax sp.]|nr:outer membrane lipoprotein LolB [Rubrivivax sp.]
MASGAALLLAACATRAPDPTVTTGRLALRVDASAERPAQNVSAGFELAGDGRQGELKLLSPLGTQLASARWAPGLALLITGDGERRFDTLDRLSREALGEALPLAAWPDWLAGRPWREAPHSPLADGFEQLGWRITTSALADGQLLARRETAPAVTLRVRLDPREPAPPRTENAAPR